MYICILSLCLNIVFETHFDITGVDYMMSGLSLDLGQYALDLSKIIGSKYTFMKLVRVVHLEWKQFMKKK